MKQIARSTERIFSFHIGLLLFIYYLLWKSYKSTHEKIIKKLQATNLRHTQVIDNKINVCNAQRWNNTQTTLGQ